VTTLSKIDIPPFDILTGDSIPFDGFGTENGEKENVEISFLKVVKESGDRIKEVFNLDVDCENVDPVTGLEDIISQMWLEGWDPETGNSNLFTRDFGSIFAREIKSQLGGKYIFRSRKRLDYMSIFWKDKKVEAFPFFKVLKRLFNKDGESLTYFFESLRKIVDDRQ
jgi:hypothetical protein